MANIGIVYRDSYKKEGKDIPIIMLDIRTISIRKKFTISVNKNKYPDGVVNDNIVQGKEDYPDYHIWCNMANRGETGRSEIVGSIKDAVAEGSGLKYKRCKIFDPFISEKNIYFTLFSVDEDKKRDASHVYNVVAQPYQKPQSEYNNTQNEQTAQPSYDGQNIPTTYETVDKNSVPSIDVDEDEIPF